MEAFAVLIAVFIGMGLGIAITYALRGDPIFTIVVEKGETKVTVPELKVALERPEAKTIYKTPNEESKKEAEEMTQEYSHLNATIQDEISVMMGEKKEDKR